MGFEFHTFEDFDEREIFSHPSRTPFLSGDWLLHVSSHLEPTERYGMAVEKDSSAFVWLTVGSRKGRLGLLHRSIGLNEPSSKKLESITTEYNGLLGQTESFSLIHASRDILRLFASRPDWHELRINALDAEQRASLEAAAVELGWITHLHSQQLTYSTKLTKCKDERVETLFSPNTRQQIKRMDRKIHKEVGSLSFEVSANTEQALDWLNELSILHRAKWNANGESSGFANHHFFNFHKDIIRKWHPENRLRIFRLVTAQSVVGYLHFYLHNQSAFFNMSGINYDEFAKYKPGLLLHWYCMEHFRKKGFELYDFMGGTNRYKESLCTDKSMQFGLIIRRPLLRFKIEHYLRQLKRKRAKTIVPPSDSALLENEPIG
jgi:CelD/BcsL family acetyltransferase involved in cellulose biosynthesis